MIPGLLPQTGLATVTLTGLDRHVDVVKVAALSKRYPLLEWGVLLGARPEELRYPSWEELEGWASFRQTHGVRMALHLCGKFAKQWLAKDPEVVNLASQFSRIQLNIIGKGLNHQDVRQALIDNAHPAVITQENRNNHELNQHLMGLPNHMVLFDSSGGRGIVAAQWPERLEGLWCGYAGGLGPDNIEQELNHIHPIAGQSYWIDMEGKLRQTNDALDLDRCEQVLQKVEAWVQNHSL